MLYYYLLCNLTVLVACKGPCDSRYGTDCYCVVKKNWELASLGFQFTIDDYIHIDFQPYISNNMTRIFVDDSVIARGFKNNNGPCLRDIRIHI